MAQREISIRVNVQDELEARVVRQALEDIAAAFRPGELSRISKKVQLPLVQMKIRSMI